jgi:hypothetical protein
MREILARLPADFPSPILYLQHLSRSYRSPLVELLQYFTVLKVRWAEQGDRLAAGVVYVCPPGSSLQVTPDGTLTLVPMATSRQALHAADRFLASVAASYGYGAVAIVLSGAGWDGAEGVCAVQEQHGTVLVQDEDSAFVWGMPKAALATGCVDLVMPLREIAPVLVNLVRDGYPLTTLQASIAKFTKRTAMSVTPGLWDALGRLLTMALSINRTDLGNIQLVDRKTGALAIVAQRGFGLNFLEHFGAVRAQDECACGRAMRAREPVFIADVTTDPLFAVHRDIAASAGFRAVQSTPLISRNGALLGMMSTHFRAPNQLPYAELRTLEQHARLSADRIEQMNGR